MNAPRSSAAAPVQSRWSLIRASSPMITRMYWQRLVSSMSRSFSTALCQATSFSGGLM